ncbi:MAG: radical SAM protein [Anaerolineae bacterium]|nr:radical SAM protein [Anaerolineae bacterium]
MPEKLNLASFTAQTYALGPGLRAALWVQGCVLNCPACIVPEWQVSVNNLVVDVNQVYEWIIESPAITGLTISGGEPMLQAAALNELIDLVKKERDLDIVCYSGYPLENLLKQMINNREIARLLDNLDVLIDGPYIQKWDDNKGLRGSSNQRIHYLTPRLKYFDFENAPRTAEFQIFNHEMILVGVPPQGVLPAFEDVSRQLHNMRLAGAEV